MAKNFKVTVLRYANASPATASGHEGDLARPLSNKGREQACKRGEKLGTIYAPWTKFSKVFASPAERTMQTAGIVGGGIPRDLIQEVSAFCFQPAEADANWAAFTAGFNELGYAPLASYLNLQAYCGPVMKVGEIMGAALMELVADLEDGAHVLVVTHAVMGPAMIHARTDDITVGRRVEAISMAEAGGFTAVFTDGFVTDIVELDLLEAQAA